MASAHFRANVVAVVTDSRDRVLAFERGDLRGQWQFPQGGVDRDETPVGAVWRELEEETGLTTADVQLVTEYPEWLTYEWPEHLRRGGRLGQCQRFFVFRVNDDTVEPQPDGEEFVDWAWVDRAWLIEQVVDFRRASYRRVLGG